MLDKSKIFDVKHQSSYHFFMVFRNLSKQFCISCRKNRPGAVKNYGTVITPAIGTPLTKTEPALRFRKALASAGLSRRIATISKNSRPRRYPFTA